jgi:CubicO group peptidase (beta-lactamase class C family)
MLRAFLTGFAAVMAMSLLASAAPSTLPAAGAAAISAFLKDAVDKGQVPGIVALVVGRDGVVYHEAFGKQDVGKNVPMAKNSIFRIASMTKPVTSIGVMMLVEEGKVGLDDDAGKWVPAMRARQVMYDLDGAAGTWKTRPAKGPITIRQLLTHTSGIGYSWSDPGLALVQRKEMPQEDALPLVDDPGKRWTYGSSTRVLGDVIEKVSGQRIDAYLQARILGPLGMRDTFFEVPKDRYGRVVTTHQKQNGKLKETPNPATIPVQLRADGGLLSTAGDYARFIRMMLNDGQLDGARILSERTVSDVGRNHMGAIRVRQQPSAAPELSKPYPLGAGSDTWGLGFQLAGPPVNPLDRSEGSMSWAGIFNTEFWIDPKREIGGILLMQMLPFYDADAIRILQGFEQLVNQHVR